MTENISIILVEPQGPINIGSVCRTMMNFGFTNLRLVNPTKHYKSLPAKKMALSAFSVLEKAPVFNDLQSALSDIQIAFGTVAHRTACNCCKFCYHSLFIFDPRIAHVIRTLIIYLPHMLNKPFQNLLWQKIIIPVLEVDIIRFEFISLAYASPEILIPG